MSLMPDIPGGGLDEWLVELKPYQRNSIKQLMQAMSEEQAARYWVTAQGSQQIVGFGGVPERDPFWDRFKEEFRRFICDDNAYTKEKKALSAQAPATRALMISTVSAALGATIGHSASLIAPAVTVMLFITVKVGRVAYCGQTKAGDKAPAPTIAALPAISAHQ